MKDIEVSLFKSYLFEKDIKSNPTCRASTVYFFLFLMHIKVIAIYMNIKGLVNCLINELRNFESTCKTLLDINYPKGKLFEGTRFF